MQKTGLKRDSIDKYYTKPAVVDLCIATVARHLHIHHTDTCIEPSAGNGAFIPGIKTLCENYLFYDILPENNEILQRNFLTGDIKDYGVNAHVIGNPPFGRQSSIAIKFIRTACLFCKSFSFILPKSFKKDSMRNKVPINFHLLAEINLPSNAFLVNGVEYDVPCVFQVWERGAPRAIIDKIQPIGYKFTTKNDNPNISVRRVGVNAGVVSPIIDKSTQSHYFIKFDNIVNLDVLSNIVYTFDNTVGPRSISKQELIVKFNEVLQNIQ